MEEASSPAPVPRVEESKPAHRRFPAPLVRMSLSLTAATWTRMPKKEVGSALRRRQQMTLHERAVENPEVDETLVSPSCIRNRSKRCAP